MHTFKISVFLDTIHPYVLQPSFLQLDLWSPEADFILNRTTNVSNYIKKENYVKMLRFMHRKRILLKGSHTYVLACKLQKKNITKN